MNLQILPMTIEDLRKIIFTEKQEKVMMREGLIIKKKISIPIVYMIN